MPIVPFVPLIAAGVGAAGAVASANASNRGQQQAAQASQTAADQATAEQRRQYDLSRADNAPWLATGQSALSQLAGLYGLNQGATAAQPQTQQYPLPTQGSGVIGGTGFGGGMTGNKYVDGYDYQQLAPADPTAPQVNGGGGNGYTPPATTATGTTGNLAPFFTSPDYQFRQNEQMRALTARNASLGIQDSGAAQRSALQYSGNLASGEFNNYANRLASLAGVGQTAAGQNQALGANYANSVSQIGQNNAQNLASSYTNRADTRANLYGGLAGSLTSGLQWLGNRYG